MKRRLYFLLPNIRSAQTIHNELLLARIEERRMHVVAREELDLADLPEASLLQKSDILHGAQLGFIIGGFTGAIMGSLAASMGMIAAGLEVWSVASITIGGAFLGTWASSMVAINIPNTRHKPFMQAIQDGKLLLIVDVPVQRVEEITEMVKNHHPEANVQGIEPTIPAFP